VSKAALVALGLPVPAHVLVHEEAELEAAVAKVGFPCATKPLDLGGGKGVNAGHQNLDDVRAGFLEARAASPNPVMVEAFVPGEDHRLMVVDGVVRAAIRRTAAQVVGDGRRTVRELAAAQNVTRDARSLVASGYLRPIALDGSAQRCLAQQGVSLDTVLADRQRVKLRSNANLSTGGSCTDVTAQVHPHVRTMAETLARTLNLSLMGADYLTTNLSRAPGEVGGAFIEFNLTPGLGALIVAGWTTVDAGRLALGESVGRIELDLLLVPDAQLDSMAGALAAVAWPSTEGWASSAQAMLAGATLQVRAMHPWAGVRTLLAHRGLERALLLCGLGQLERHGLPVDRLGTVHVGGVAPSAQWQQVLVQASQHTSVWPDALSAVQACVLHSGGS
jgi:cyanophycin synthetase